MEEIEDDFHTNYELETNGETRSNFHTSNKDLSEKNIEKKESELELKESLITNSSNPIIDSQKSKKIVKNSIPSSNQELNKKSQDPLPKNHNRSTELISIKPNYADYNTMKSDTSNYTSIKKMKNSLSIDMENNCVIKRSKHEYYSFTCGMVDGIENFKSVNDHDNEIVLKTMRWIIAEKYKPLLSDRNLLLVKQRENISFEKFEEIVQNLGLSEISGSLELPQRIKIKEKNDEELERVLSLAIKFYTGDKSEFINRMIAIQIYSYFTSDEENSIEECLKNEKNHIHNPQEIKLICSYLYSALSMLPLYWGHCQRLVQLTSQEFENYLPGRIICWTQFSSSSKTIKVFKERNTIFQIYSQTGRDIENFSLLQVEQEVLFLPMSQFLVQKVEEIEVSIKDEEKETNKVYRYTQIWLKQIELGTGEQNILWVDDKIHEKNWANKSIIEISFTYTTNVKFILKNSTDTALAYLESICGQDKKNQPDNFRIISDMNRPEEEDGENAGARFFKLVLNMGFTCKMMIFTMVVKDSQKKLEKYEVYSPNILVTSKSRDAIDFITFK